MKSSFLKTSPVMLSAILSMSRLLEADQLEHRVSQLENKMNQVRIDTVRGNYTALTASGRPQNEGYGMFLTADLIVWTVYEGSAYHIVSDTNTAVQRSNPNDLGFLPNTSAPLISSIYNTDIQADFKRVPFDWKCGYKVGIGYKMPHDGWDTYLNYTQFLTHGTKSTTQPAPPTTRIPSSLANLISGFVNYDTITDSTNDLKTRRDLHFYNVDFELGRSFFVSQYLSMRPNFGLKSAWIRQKLKSTNEYNFNNLIVVEQSVTQAYFGSGKDVTTLEGKNNFWGFGPRAGVDLNWFLGKHFSIFSEVSGAVLWGKFNIDQMQTTTYNATPSGVSKAGPFNVTYTEDLSSGPHRFVPTAQFSLGAAYTTTFADDAYNFSVKAAYENQYWWRQNYLNAIALDPSLVTLIIEPFAGGEAFLARSINNPTFSALEDEGRLSSPDDLGFHGFTLEFRLDF